MVQERKDLIAEREGVDAAQVPADAVTASGVNVLKLNLAVQAARR